MLEKNDVYTTRYRLRDELQRLQREHDLIEAWIGLYGLLDGAWGTENVDALGGGKTQIERAFAVLSVGVTTLVDRVLADGPDGDGGA